MSDTVSDFFSKGKIRKYVCDAENYAIKAATGLLLSSAFTACSPSESKTDNEESGVKTAYAITEKGDTLCSYNAVAKDSASFARLQKLVNNATKSKTGCSILKSVSKQGTTLTLDQIKSTTVGFFCAETNSITLNQAFGDATLQSCLIHEAKHSVQQNSMAFLPNYMYDFESNTIISRAKEADAVATQTKFSYELMQAGDSAAWKDLRLNYPEITHSFKTQAQKHGVDSKQAMKSAMMKWYDNIPYSSLYDASMIEYCTNVSQKTSAPKLRQMFTQTVNADSVVSRVCSLDGVSYAGTDGSVLKTPRTLSMTAESYTQAEKFQKLQMSRCGRNDTSAANMFVAVDGQPSEITFAKVLSNINKDQTKTTTRAYQIALGARAGR